MMNDTPPKLFANYDTNCKPIAVKSRKYSLSDRKFIDSELRKLLQEDVIETSASP